MSKFNDKYGNKSAFHQADSQYKPLKKRSIKAVASPQNIEQEKSHGVEGEFKKKENFFNVKSKNMHDLTKQRKFYSNSLLEVPSSNFTADLAQLINIINELFPIKSQHRRSLPNDVHELSLILTEERARLKTPYWAAPRFLSAYLRYFLPWNLVRLAWLFPKLDLSLKNGSTILDCGSGPLTLPIALWLHRPDLRSLKLNFVCTDTGSSALEAGKQLFTEYTGGKSSWSFKTIRSNLGQSLAHFRKPEHKADLIMLGNMLNELSTGNREPLDQLLGQLSVNLQKALNPKGQVLVVEPGTRLGSKLTTNLRFHALRTGYEVLSPCTHQEPCPLLDPAARSWCHFSFPVLEVPRALSSLSVAAKLEKQRASLAFLFLQNKHIQDVDSLDDDYFDEDCDLEEYSENLDCEAGQRASANHATFNQKNTESLKNKTCEARIVSGKILIPGNKDMAFTQNPKMIDGRYACTSHGLALICPFNKPEGSKVTIRFIGERDKKSGALLATEIIAKG
ncbi:small ribosomal subunit Rsm22 family protein [Desulfovibrio litoralis]|uniref:Small ribosomal subunit Rsm22 n=1 Tax=Desulfovibrio litoralis DSM 11393 TaxID=1121455 RepID=A0A1M7RYA9_9BACT|nr:small ribosomal subunit Rsm22 family protein [Desulfovibrio litoralis]SHN51263.1 small ribosomal subunit Rsm22 [Desulfovibrio litoralis DSM 11393]